MNLSSIFYQIEKRKQRHMYKFFLSSKHDLNPDHMLKFQAQK